MIRGSQHWNGVHSMDTFLPELIKISYLQRLALESLPHSQAKRVTHKMTNSILEKQIGLRQLASDTFAAHWHEDWAVGPSESASNIKHLLTVFAYRLQLYLVVVSPPLFN